MSLINLENDNFSDLIKVGTVLVDFYAEWCGPCKMLSPILEQLSSEQQDVKIIKINVDKHQDLAGKYGVMSIPKLILFKDGEMLSVKQGFQSKDMLSKWIEEGK